MAVLAPGTLIGGRYNLDRLLGEGGMGSVWAATHTVTGGRVALKFVKGGVHEEARRRLLREARVATLVEHPNVVTIRDVFDHEDVPVIVMDLLQGETLADRLGREGRLTLEECARITMAVIAAAGAAHEIGLIHRDLKPENVFLHRSGSSEVVRVLDFGIAKIVQPDPADANASTVTQSGTLIGTPAYMAPEQLFGEKDLDHRVDVWAIGVIIHEMLAGRRPVDGDNLGQIAKKLLSSPVPVPSLAERAQGVPDDLVRMVDRMMARERADRLTDLHELAEVLAKYCAQKRPSFGPPRLRPVYDSEPEVRTLIASERRADPMAATQQAESAPRRHDVNAMTELAPSRPRSDTAVGHVTTTRPAARTRAPWILGALGLVAVGAVIARAVHWGERTPVTAPSDSTVSRRSPTATGSPALSLTFSGPTASTVTSAVTPTPPSDAGALPPATTTTSKPWAPVTVTTKPSTTGLPSVTASTPTTAGTPTAPVSATASTPGLVTKPPF